MSQGMRQLRKPPRRPNRKGHSQWLIIRPPAVLWTRFLKLRHTVPHLTGYPLGIRDLIQRRQWGR